jgi:uncharacterized protein YyaL (SSP411 family)
MPTQYQPNQLVHETSPYLLQHAYNPVAWFPWGEEALAKAKKEDKPIILSIGYSACHWCHVMERESFEDIHIAQLMNRHYVCIKVDREERPDIDQIYMDAVHAMGLQGGWPLNIVLTPDAKPFYGGTYFPPQRWATLLDRIQEAFENDREKLEESAEGFAVTLNRSESEKYELGRLIKPLQVQHYKQMFQHLASSFDREKGGMNRAPKFPMPCVWTFLLRYATQFEDKEAEAHLHLTLKKIALGGIYDQIGGGFARYSTDEEWFAPHFEKMLYDNGQLLRLYAEAYQSSQIPLYKEVVYETIAFVQRELTSAEDGFYSALDADSEGEEGKFYVWKFDEIEKLPIQEKVLFAKYYQLFSEGNWEHGQNILHREKTLEEFCAIHALPEADFKVLEASWKSFLLQEREKRPRPGLDDKILASWNGLMLTGLVDAYRVFGEESFLDLALRNAAFIEKKLISQDRLFHSYKNGQSKIEGYLEDYAAIIQAFTNLYQATFEEKWLLWAEKLTETCFRSFWDEKEGLFFFTSSESEKLIARKKEIFDNVVPASNSIMADNLLVLGHLLSRMDYVERGTWMIQQVQNLLEREPYYLANWASLSIFCHTPIYEVAICGPDALEMRKQLDAHYFPHKVVAGGQQTSSLPLLENRILAKGKTTVYVCQNQTCQLPVTSVEEAMDLLRK